MFSKRLFIITLYLLSYKANCDNKLILKDTETGLELNPCEYEGNHYLGEIDQYQCSLYEDKSRCIHYCYVTLKENERTTGELQDDKDFCMLIWNDANALSTIKELTSSGTVVEPTIGGYSITTTSVGVNNKNYKGTIDKIVCSENYLITKIGILVLLGLILF